MEVAKRLHTVEEYYFSKKLREVRGLIAQGKPVINMGIGSPDLAPAPQVLEAMNTASYEDGAHQYQNYQGLPELRNAIANFYKTHFKVAINPENEVLPLMGSKEGIMHISMAYLNEGDEALIPNPGYPTYTSVTKLVQATPVYYDLTAESNWFPDLEALEKRDLSKVKIMWLSYPHMPTGAKPTVALFEALIAFAKKHQILLVNDNPYSFVLNDEQRSILALPEAKEVAVELNSLSKSFNMAGWRVGMVLGSKEHISAILKVKSNMDSGMFYSVQKGAIAALQLDKDWFASLNEVYAKRKKLVLELVQKLGCTYDPDSVGMFVWCKLPEGITSSETFIDEVLYDKHVFITPGTIFGDKGEGYIRFSLCVTEEKIQEAINRF
ncbi:aminotransferase [Neptunitalea chrysea]|uniref:Aminotransferase n=1 Tax=Neptunitalea chrysea TaxID=1647581 RepID=A0A9W6B3X8_9FLAO|nr:aminotransferase [Neptunitalea chrysea]